MHILSYLQVQCSPHLYILSYLQVQRSPHLYILSYVQVQYSPHLYILSCLAYKRSVIRHSGRCSPIGGISVMVFVVS